jgi:hypothetical protein
MSLKQATDVICDCLFEISQICGIEVLPGLIHRIPNAKPPRKVWSAQLINGAQKQFEVKPFCNFPNLLSKVAVHDFCFHLRTNVLPFDVLKQRVPALPDTPHVALRAKLSAIVPDKGPSYWQADHSKKRCRNKPDASSMKCFARNKLRLVLPAKHTEQTM